MDAVTHPPTCEICGQEFEMERLVKLHMKEEHERFGAQCPFCDLNQIDIDELRFHVNTAHKDIVSPLRSSSTNDPPTVLKDDSAQGHEAVNLIEVSPRQFDNNQVHVITELSVSQEFCSPQKKRVLETSSLSDSTESIPMEVFYDSNGPQEDSLSLPDSEEKCSPQSSDEAKDVPKKGTSQSGNQNKRLISEVEGLWEGEPSTSGSSEVIADNDLSWLIESSDSEEEGEDSTAGGLGRVIMKPKETLLNLSKRAKHIDEPILCPFCGLGDYDPEVIQSHVDQEHADEVPSKATMSPKNSRLIPKSETTGSRTDTNGSTTKRKLFTDGDSPSVELTNKEISKNTSCPVCQLDGFSSDQLELHVNSHFESNPGNVSGDRLVAEQLHRQEKQLQERRENEHLKLLQKQFGMDNSGSYKSQAEANLKKAIYRGDIGIADFYNQKSKLQRVYSTGEEDNRYRTSGVIVSLSRFYSSNVYNVDHARLAEQTDHFASSPGCRGWGCGYRNLQMLLSAMWQDAKYREVVFNGKNAIPSIVYIQRLIENAWRKGFDPAGMEQLGQKLVNTRKWIGATEIAAVLHSLRVRCKLLDFHKCTGQGGTHPKMFEWVRDYFGRPSIFGVFGKEEAAMSKKMPLYLQHHGHSRTIVGYEVLKDGSMRLLIFDPSTKSNDMASLRAGNITGAALRPLRKTLSQMKHKQYQVVAVMGVISSDKEYEERKLLTSVRIP